MRLHLAIRAALAGVCLLTIVRMPAADEPADDEQRLKKDLGGADGDRLIAYLRGQIPTAASREKLAALIEQMGDRSFKTRQEATRKLVEAGPVALSLLRAASNHPDKEIAARARRCVSDLLNGPGSDLPAVIVRHLGRTRNEKAIDVLLEYLPSVAGEPLYDQILATLGTLALTGKTVHPALKKAVEDPLIRAAAVQLLLKAEDADARKLVRSFLNDKDPVVRFHVAMHYFGKGDRDTVPVLIGLVADAPNSTIWQQAEESLYALAGELAPAVEINGGASDDRKQASEKWAEWWKVKGDQVLFGRKDEHPNDTCVVSETGRTNRVFEWKPEGKPRFEISNLTGPVDARILPGNRVLIAEQNAQRVSEWSFSGKMLWQRSVEGGPVSVQRLPSGNTFVATTYRVLELTRDGKTVYSHAVDAPSSISDANRLTDGRIAMVTTDAKLIFMNVAGKELKRIDVDSQGALEALPDGRVLLSQVGTGRITEFDATYAKLMDVKIEGAWMATRLPDGNTLVASKTRQKMTKIDKAGKTIWEKDVAAFPHSIHWK
jgi:HEAT repeat protein